MINGQNAGWKEKASLRTRFQIQQQFWNYQAMNLKYSD